MIIVDLIKLITDLFSRLRQDQFTGEVVIEVSFNKGGISHANKNIKELFH